MTDLFFARAQMAASLGFTSLSRPAGLACRYCWRSLSGAVMVRVAHRRLTAPAWTSPWR